MANIVPLSELIYNSSRISKLCHGKNEPVFLTKDGYGDMVVLSMDQYELLNARAQAYLATAKANSMTPTPALEDNAREEAEDNDKTSALDRLGIEKLPLEDVVDILRGVTDKQQALDPKGRKRFP
jgi:hypothetical protein